MSTHALDRRRWLKQVAQVASFSAAAASSAWSVQSWASTSTEPAAGSLLQAALKDFAGGATLQRGRLKIDVDALVENGNAVPIALTYVGPLAHGVRVRALGLFTELNPAPEVAVFRWPEVQQGAGPAHMLPRVSTRMRLATSQGITAVALLSDGSGWIDRVEVLVTLAACIEES